LIWPNFFLNDGLNHNMPRLSDWPKLNPGGLVAQEEIGRPGELRQSSFGNGLEEFV
jgi:hypothetical protein